MNSLQGLPISFSRLTRLVVLALASNQLEEVPRPLGHLPALSTLDMAANKLKSLHGFGPMLVRLLNAALSL